MKHSKTVTRGLVAVFALSLSFARPVLAQQEVSPDHYDSTSVQDQQVSKALPKARDSKVTANKAPKKHSSKVQHARTQTASSKKVSS